MYVLNFRNRVSGSRHFSHRPASSAARLAGTGQVPGRCVAKTVVIRTGETFVLAVLPATSRVDLDRFASAVRMDRALVRLATAGEIDAIFHDCEPGTIPPFGRLYGLRTVVDASLQELGMAVFRTNARHQGLRMAFRDFEGLEEPMPAQFSEPITPPQSGHFEAHTGTQDEGGLSLGRERISPVFQVIVRKPPFHSLSGWAEFLVVMSWTPASGRRDLMGFQRGIP